MPDRAYGRPGGSYFPYNIGAGYNHAARAGVHVADSRGEAVVRHMK